MINMKKSKEEGITLIALVITIIVLLILAGVTISMLTGENGILTKAQSAKEKTDSAEADENRKLSEYEFYIQNYIISEEGYDEEGKVNKPRLKNGMIPVYYENGVWKKADENNTDKKWYNYEEKRWANIVTVADEDEALRNVEVGTEIPVEKITTFFVWIPRYAYSITSGYKEGNGATGSIDVTFLKGNTNKGEDGTEYPTDYGEEKLEKGAKTPKIVHPGFKMGSTELTGIWVAKFEASGEDKNGNAVGNANSEENKEQFTPDESTYVRILPSKISWRHITIGESEYRSMQMSENTEKYGWTNVNSHLIKNSEWGAVSYLCYSKYGAIPKTNGAGSIKSNSHWYNLYTGAGPYTETNETWYGKKDGSDYNGGEFKEETHGYSTTIGQTASTTGNVYGVYDMAGGAWDRVATYLDNGNGNLNSYGKNKAGDVLYFENGKLNEEYNLLWDAYQVSDEEKNNAIVVEGESKTLTQGELWNWNKKEEKYQQARYRLTQAIYNNMAKYKGIGVNETSTEFSFYAPYSTVENRWGWFKTVSEAVAAAEIDDTAGTAGRTWNNDYVYIGHASCPFVVRGGSFDVGSDAGVLTSYITGGNAYYYNGFRPVLAF